MHVSICANMYAIIISKFEIKICEYLILSLRDDNFRTVLLNTQCGKITNANE